MLKIVDDSELPEGDDGWWKIKVFFTDQVTEIMKQEGFPEEINEMLEKLGEGALYRDTSVHLSQGNANLTTITRSGHSVHFCVVNGKAAVYCIGVCPPVEVRLLGAVWPDVIRSVVSRLMFWR